MADPGATRSKRTRRTRPGPDIRAVAQRARVSIVTVSRTMNGAGPVDPRTANRVWRAIEHLGYVPNSQARSLRSGRSYLLGLIVLESAQVASLHLILSFEKQAVQRGYEVLLCFADDDAQHLAACVRRMRERCVEGIAILHFSHADPPLVHPQVDDSPIVFLEGGTMALNPGEAPSCEKIVRDSVEQLIALGQQVHNVNARSRKRPPAPRAV